MQAEFKTLFDLHGGKIVELSKLQLTQTTRDSIRANQDEIEGIRKYASQMFGTSKSAIADEKKKVLMETAKKLKELRAEVTADFLHGASVTSLEELRTKIPELQTNFMTKYEAIDFTELRDEDIGELVLQKAEVETTPNVDRIIQGEINAKLKDVQGSGSGQSGQTRSEREDYTGTQAGKTGQQANYAQDEQLRALQDQVRDLLQKGKATAETIESLEQKLSGASHEDSSDSIVLFEEDAMVGDQAPSDPNIGEQDTVGLKVGSIDIPIFGGNLEV